MLNEKVTKRFYMERRCVIQVPQTSGLHFHLRYKDVVLTEKWKYKTSKRLHHARERWKVMWRRIKKRKCQAEISKESNTAKAVRKLKTSFRKHSLEGIHPNYSDSQASHIWGECPLWSIQITLIANNVKWKCQNKCPLTSQEYSTVLEI